jgi:hypothetical protein
MGKSSKKTGRSRGRKLVRLLALVGIGVLVRQKLQAAKAPAAEPYVPRTPAPAPAEPPQAVIPTSPVEPEAPAPVNPDPEPEAIEQLETEAPIAPEDSLTSFFDDVMNESKESHRG